ADRKPEQRAAHRREYRDLAFAARIARVDELELILAAAVFLHEAHPRVHGDHARGDLLRVDDIGTADLGLDLLAPREIPKGRIFQEALDALHVEAGQRNGRQGFFHFQLSV